MRVSGSTLRFPYIQGELQRSHSRRGRLWEQARAKRGSLVAGALLLVCGLLLLGIVSVGLVNVETETQVPSRRAPSVPDLPVANEPGMIFQNEDRVYYVQ